MSEKLRADVLVPDQLFGTAVYTVSVTVTNTSQMELRGVDVESVMLPGRLLSIQEDPSEAEVSQLYVQRRKLIDEMERQLGRAYERSHLKSMNVTDSLLYTFARAIDVYASVFAFRRPAGTLPPWAHEAVRIEDWKDVENLEQYIMIHEGEESFLRKAFALNKDKLQRCLAKIAERNAATPDLRAGLTLQPGGSITFPFSVKAPHLLRPRHADLQFKLTFCDEGSDKVTSQSVTRRILFFPSAFAVPTGSMLGAACGYLIKLALLSSDSPGAGKISLSLGGSVLLGLVVALLTARKPDVNKAITVEDFLGGFLVGAITGLFSENMLSRLSAILH